MFKCSHTTFRIECSIGCRHLGSFDVVSHVPPPKSVHEPPQSPSLTTPPLNECVHSPYTQTHKHTHTHIHTHTHTTHTHTRVTRQISFPFTSLVVDNFNFNTKIRLKMFQWKSFRVHSPEEQLSANFIRVYFDIACKDNNRVDFFPIFYRVL